MQAKNETKYRHELKYLISAAEVEILKGRLEHLLDRDSHAGPSGSYSIRSLYFDDMDNRCYYENENGTDPREKFRIRIYNGSAQRITLECKRKQRGKTLKTSCLLTEEQTRSLLAGKVISDIADQPPLLQKFTAQMLLRGLRPVVIVEYLRIPYIYKNGNVRITLDMNVSSSRDFAHFLDPIIQTRSVLSTGQQLLEVKFDEYLPDFIHRNLQLGHLSQTAFSKFYICRKYLL